MHWKEVPTSLRPAHPSPRMTSQRSHTSSSTAGSSSDNNYGNELWHNGAGLLSEESLTDSDSHNYRSEPEKPHRSPHLCANKLRKQRPASMHSTLPTSRSGDHLPALSSPAAAEKSKRRFSLPRMTHVQPPPITEQPATPPSSARLSSIYRKRKKRQSALGETLEPYCHLPAPSSFDPMFSTPYDAVVPRAQKTGVSRQSPSNTLLHPSQLGSEHTSPPPVPKIDSVWLSASPPAAAPADVKPMPSQQIADNSGLGKPKNSKAYRLRASWSSSSQVEVQLSERRALMRSRTMQMSNRSASIDQQLSSASSLVQESRPNWDLQKSEDHETTAMKRGGMSQKDALNPNLHPQPKTPSDVSGHHFAAPLKPTQQPFASMNESINRQCSTTQQSDTATLAVGPSLASGCLSLPHSDATQISLTMTPPSQSDATRTLVGESMVGAGSLPNESRTTLTRLDSFDQAAAFSSPRRPHDSRYLSVPPPRASSRFRQQSLEPYSTSRQNSCPPARPRPSQTDSIVAQQDPGLGLLLALPPEAREMHLRGRWGRRPSSQPAAPTFPHCQASSSSIPYDQQRSESDSAAPTTPSLLSPESSATPSTESDTFTPSLGSLLEGYFGKQDTRQHVPTTPSSCNAVESPPDPQTARPDHPSSPPSPLVMPKSANPHRRSLSSILGFRAKSAPSTPTSECHQLPDMSKKSFKLHRKLTKRGSRAPPPPPPPRDINVSSLSLAKAGPYFGCNGSDQSTLEIRHRDQPKGHTFGTDDDPESDQASPLPVVESLNHANSYDFNHDLEAGHSRARSFDPTLSTQSSFPVSPTVSGGNISPGLEDHSPGGVRDNFVRLFPESESTEQSAESTDDSEDAVMFRSKRLHVERTARQMKRVVAIINIPNPEDYLKAMIAFKQEGLPVDEAAPEVSEVEKAQLLIIRELIFIEMKYESQLARLSKVVKEHKHAKEEDDQDELGQLVRRASQTRVSMTPSASRNQSFKSMPAGAVVHEDLAAAMTPVRLLEKYLPKLQKSSSDFTAAWLKDPTPQGIANGLLSSTDELELSFLGWMRVFPCIQDAFRMSEYARQTSAPASMPPSPSTRRLSKDRKSCLVEDGGVSDSAAPSAHHPAGVAKATATVNESERVAPVRRKSWVRSTTRNKNSKEAAERRINIISSILITPLQQFSRYTMMIDKLLKLLPRGSPIFMLMTRANLRMRALVASANAAETKYTTEGSRSYAHPESDSH